MSRFEDSCLSGDDTFSPHGIMECKICWTPYDPQAGDDVRQIDPGTPFGALPDDWSCPKCAAPKDQFLVIDNTKSEAAAVQAAINARTTRLVTDFREMFHARMRDVAPLNAALQVEAVGFRMHEDRPVGVLIGPWFMNIVVLPGEGEDWSDLEPGIKEYLSFPSGDYEFLHNTRELTGGYKYCSLFSAMNDFTGQSQAVAVARSVMDALFECTHAVAAEAASEHGDADAPAQPDQSRIAASAGPARTYGKEG